MAVNKREILQRILDKIEPGWSVKKPTPAQPYDLATECLFQQTNPGDNRQARVIIGNELFVYGKIAAIEDLVLRAVSK